VALIVNLHPGWLTWPTAVCCIPCKIGSLFFLLHRLSPLDEWWDTYSWFEMNRWGWPTESWWNGSLQPNQSAWHAVNDGWQLYQTYGSVRSMQLYMLPVAQMPRCFIRDYMVPSWLVLTECRSSPIVLWVVLLNSHTMLISYLQCCTKQYFRTL